jgi:hypothetical protein
MNGLSHCKYVLGKKCPALNTIDLGKEIADADGTNYVLPGHGGTATPEYFRGMETSILNETLCHDPAHVRCHTFKMLEKLEKLEQSQQ